MKQNYEDKLYDDPDLEMIEQTDTGQKLCSFAIIWFIISLVISLLFAIQGIYLLSQDVGVVWLIVALINLVANYLIYLLLLGYGELVQAVNDILQTNQAILAHIKNKE